MPTITFSIGGPEIDISGKSEKQIVELVKEEYNKKKKIKFIKKKKKVVLAATRTKHLYCP